MCNFKQEKQFIICCIIVSVILLRTKYLVYNFTLTAHAGFCKSACTVKGNYTRKTATCKNCYSSSSTQSTTHLFFRCILKTSKLPFNFILVPMDRMDFALVFSPLAQAELSCWTSDILHRRAWYGLINCKLFVDSRKMPQVTCACLGSPLIA